MVEPPWMPGYHPARPSRRVRAPFASSARHVTRMDTTEARPPRGDRAEVGGAPLNGGVRGHALTERRLGRVPRGKHRHVAPPPEKGGDVSILPCLFNGAVEP